MTQHTKESLMALVNDYRECHADDLTSVETRQARAALSTATAHIVAERDALKADAERYRWLRDTNNLEEGWWSQNAEILDLTELDEAIDAAMKETT